MKTTGLNFLEAVRVLASKKCKEIESPNGMCYIMVGGVVHRKDSGCGGIHAAPDAFLGEWSLIGVKQKVTGTIKWGRDSNGHVRPTEFRHDNGELKGRHVDTYYFPQKPTMKATLEWEE